MMDGSILVTPLQPPFDGDVTFFQFENGKELAVSKSDGDRIKALFGGNAKGRSIVLAAADEEDQNKICIYATQ